MGLQFATPARQSSGAKNRPSDFLLHQLGCRACPLNRAAGLHSPKMEATGSDDPLIYVLGEAPGEIEDQEGRQFVGPSGDFVRPFIPGRLRSRVRWNNVLSCFPSGTLVRAEGIERIYRRYYEGDLVVIKTARGNELSGTPNHPIKTLSGFMPLGTFKVGDDLFSRLSGDLVGWCYPHVNHAPIQIEKLFDAYSDSAVRQRVIGSCVDFHGDGRDGDVDVVVLDRKLGISSESRVLKKLYKGPFVVRLKRQSYSQFFGSVHSHAWSVFSKGFYSRKAALFSVFGLPPRSSADLRGSLGAVPIGESAGGVSYLDTSFFEKFGNCSWFNLLRHRDLCGTFAGPIPFDNIGSWAPPGVVSSVIGDSFSASSDFDIIGPKKMPEGSRGAMYQTAQTVEALPFGVEIDHVISIERRPFAGHVFNLQVKGGLYLSENILVSNCHPPMNRDPEKIEVEACRPRVTADIERTKPRAIFGLGAFALSWADKPSGIELWRGRRFPIRVGSHACWFYPMRHPSFILHVRRNGYKSDDEIAFAFDIRRAIAEVEEGLPEPVVHTAEFARDGITCVTGRSAKDLNYVLEFLEYAGTRRVVGVDDETQNLRPYLRDSVILTRAVSVEDETLAFAWRHPEAGWSSSDLRELEAAWIRFLKSRAKKAAHNAAFEMEWDCFFYGNELARSVPWEDTQTQAYVRDERVGDHKPGALALEFISLQHFGINIKRLTSGLNKQRMASEPLSVILPYNGIDAKYHRLNYDVQADLIEAEGLTEVYREKLRQVPTVVLTQLKGVRTDPEETIRLEREYAAKLEEVSSRIQRLPEADQFRRLTGRRFNPGSPDDVLVVLRDVLKTRAGQEGPGWTTREAALSKVESPIAQAVLDYRGVQKLKSTYVDPYMPGSPYLYDGNVLHANFGTTFTETGRLNCSDPNLQNQPTRNAEAKKVRRQIKAPVVASLDAGQIDARMIACGSRDPYYCKALYEDYDIHMEWARRLALRFPDFIGGKKNLSDLDVMEKFRSGKVKNNWVFALFYGAALRTTAGRFGVEEDALRPLYDEFWKQFALVKVWQERLVKQFEEHGYVQMLGGLRRRAPLGRGQIVNTPVQGATNRIVMHGMNGLSETGILALQPNMQIHDDLTYQFGSNREYEDNIERIIDTMLDCREFDWICVPLVVDLKDGPTWADMGKVGTFSSYKRLGWPVRAREFQ